MKHEVLNLEILGRVARLTINRPDAMNTINFALLDALDSQLAELAAEDAPLVLIVTGRGKAFCAGADLKEMLAASSTLPGQPDFIDRCNAVLGRLRNFPKPVIAALNGVTIAGGLELAMCADIVVAAESARIGDGHANYGVYPGAGGTAILPRLIPANMAMYLLFTGRTLSAAEMKTFGLVCEVHPDEDLQEAALALATEIATKSSAALRRVKTVASASLDKSRADALAQEQVMLREHQRSYDLNEGLRAFAEKRAPEFRGH